MERSRFVQPESRKLDLSDGDWLLVRKRLTTGEQRAAYLNAYVVGTDGEYRPHPALLPFVKVCAYLLDWSLTNGHGEQQLIRDQPAGVIAAAVDALDPADFAEIRQAIDAHELRVLAERAAQKKTQPGVTPSSPTFVSPSVAAGVSTTSEGSMLTSASS